MVKFWFNYVLEYFCCLLKPELDQDMKQKVWKLQIFSMFQNEVEVLLQTRTYVDP